MKHRTVAGALLAALLPLANLHAAEQTMLGPLATCQESWLSWKQDPARGRAYREAVESAFKAQDREPFWLPTRPTTLFGHPIDRLYPDSVGMAVGFSALANASFEAVKTSLEQQVGKPITRCESEGGARSCELKIGEKKTVIIMEAARGKNPQTLFGCYYFYAP
jgi:hypothetical protein